MPHMNLNIPEDVDTILRKYVAEKNLQNKEVAVFLIIREWSTGGGLNFDVIKEHKKLLSRIRELEKKIEAD